MPADTAHTQIAATDVHFDAVATTASSGSARSSGASLMPAPRTDSSRAPSMQTRTPSSRS